VSLAEIVLIVLSLANLGPVDRIALKIAAVNAFRIKRRLT
jgi:hypothetical protein